MASDQSIEIGIYFPDTTYGQEGSDAEWEERSAALKREIEQETGLELEQADIAPGFSYPAFATFISEYWPVVAAPFALFLTGEKIDKNIDAWAGLYARVKRRLLRSAYLDQNGASIVAMNAVIEECGAAPQVARLEAYALWLLLEGPVEHNTTPIVGFADPPEEKYLGVIVHIFQIAADDRRFKVYVEANTAHLTEMPQK